MMRLGVYAHRLDASNVIVSLLLLVLVMDRRLSRNLEMTTICADSLIRKYTGQQLLIQQIDYTGQQGMEEMRHTCLLKAWSI